MLGNAIGAVGRRVLVMIEGEVLDVEVITVVLVGDVKAEDNNGELAINLAVGPAGFSA